MRSVFVLAGLALATAACSTGETPVPRALSQQDAAEIATPDVIGVVDRSVLEHETGTRVPFRGDVHLTDGTVVTIDAETRSVTRCRRDADLPRARGTTFVPSFAGCLVVVQLTESGTASWIVMLDPIETDISVGWGLAGSPSAVGSEVVAFRDLLPDAETALRFDPAEAELRGAVLGYGGACAEGHGLADMVFMLDDTGTITRFLGYGSADGSHVFDDPCGYVI